MNPLEHAVHLHIVSLNKESQPYDRLAALLSDDERERAGRFYFDYLTENYTIARGRMREILGEYLGMAPQDIEFAYTKFGKPYHPGAGASALEFNLSHTEKVAVLAVTASRKVGVDIEYLHKPIPEAESIARRFFSAPEIAEFLQVPEADRQAAFYNCWTRKEAYIKAVGEGLSHPLDTFDVSLTPEEPAILKTVRGNVAEAARWKLVSLTPADGYVAAVMAEGQDWELETHPMS